MSVYKEGKSWKVQAYYEDWQGKKRRKQKRGFKTKGEAKAWERDFLQKQQRSVDINFENFVEIYFEDMEHRLRENTMITKRYIMELKVTPYFKEKMISDISTSDIRAWQNRLLKEGYADTYLKTIHCQLAALFNYAVRYYDLKDNPCKKAGCIGKSKSGEMDFWTQEEFEQFLGAVEDKMQARMGFLLLFWTGIRIGELLALTYNDIDMTKKTIAITKSYQRLKGKDVITEPKTPKSNRVISMPDFLVEELKEYTSHLYGIGKKDRMFPFAKSYMEHCIVKGIKDSGVKRIRLHDLRHSHVSLLLHLGYSAVAIGERVGHKSERITLYYGHLFPGVKEEIAMILDGERKLCVSAENSL